MTTATTTGPTPSACSARPASRRLPTARLLLDEPAAGLDVAGREKLVGRLGQLAADPAAPPTILVTHHVEEIPPGFTHVLLLRQGRIVVAGPMGTALTSDTLSACFSLPLLVSGEAGRFTCRAA